MFTLITTIVCFVVFAVVWVSQVIIPLMNGQNLFPWFRHRKIKKDLSDVANDYEKVKYERDLINQYENLIDADMDNKEKLIVIDDKINKNS
jgi:hypothetical protein